MRDVLGEDAYQVVGSHPAEDTVRSAGERKRAAGAGAVRTVAVLGSGWDVLVVRTT